MILSVNPISLAMYDHHSEYVPSLPVYILYMKNQIRCTVNNGCDGRFIDASLATSLTLYCENCYSARVKCPNGEGTYCNISCILKGLDDGCNSIQIDAEYTTNLSVVCNGANMCLYMNILSGPTQEANIKCIGEGANTCLASNFFLTNTSIINMDCKCLYGQCCSSGHAPSTIFAQHSDSLNLECSYRDCVSFNVDASYSNDIIIKCDYRQGCTNSKIYAQNSNSLSINCSGDFSCNNSYIYAPSSRLNIFQMICDGIDSCDNVTIFADIDNNVFNYLNLLCSDGSCDGMNISFAGTHTTSPTEALDTDPPTESPSNTKVITTNTTQPTYSPSFASIISNTSRTRSPTILPIPTTTNDQTSTDSPQGGSNLDGLFLPMIIGVSAFVLVIVACGAMYCTYHRQKSKNTSAKSNSIHN